MIKYITDPNTIREICVDIMKAGVIPDAFNITSYLNVRKDLFDGSPEEHISSSKILGNHNDLGKYFASIELHIVPRLNINGSWYGKKLFGVRSANRMMASLAMQKRSWPSCGRTVSQS